MYCVCMNVDEKRDAVRVSGNAPDVDEFLDLLDPLFPRDEIITGIVGPVIGTHAGPRVMGVTFQVVR